MLMVLVWRVRVDDSLLVLFSKNINGQCITAEMVTSGRKKAKIQLHVQEHKVQLHDCKRKMTLPFSETHRHKLKTERGSVGVTRPRTHCAEISGTPQGNRGHKHPTRPMSQQVLPHFSLISEPSEKGQSLIVRVF